MSVGQAPEVPVQVSATSHAPALARQTVDEEANPVSVGQYKEDELQYSATRSQTPTLGRQTTLGAFRRGVHVPSILPPEATLQA